MGYTGSGTSHFSGRGFSLVELLVALAITTLLLGLGIPGFKQLLGSSQASASLMGLHALLSSARSHALARNQEVTFCGSNDGITCRRDWSGRSLVFVDANRNRTLDAGEPLLESEDFTARGEMRWRGSGGRSYLRFRSDGSVKEFGTMTWCPKSGEARHARAIIISFVGRARAARDLDQDGVREDNRGQPLDCDSG